MSRSPRVGDLQSRHVSDITAATIDSSDELLVCPDIRKHLKARPSPFIQSNNFGGGFVQDDDRVALNSMKYGSQESAGSSSTYLSTIKNLPPWAIRSGARETIFFDPAQVTAAIVTCGGLCPGLNDVVAGLVNKLESYGVPSGKILGIKYGFRGFYDPDEGKKPIVLTKKSVDGIQLQGGTILGTSRGGADIKEIVKRIDMWGEIKPRGSAVLGSSQLIPFKPQQAWTWFLWLVAMEAMQGPMQSMKCAASTRSTVA